MVWSVILSKSSMDDILTYTYTESIISEMLIMWGKYIDPHTGLRDYTYSLNKKLAVTTSNTSILDILT